MLEQGALGAIFIVLLGLVPIIWLNRYKNETLVIKCNTTEGGV